MTPRRPLWWRGTFGTVRRLQAEFAEWRGAVLGADTPAKLRADVLAKTDLIIDLEGRLKNAEAYLAEAAEWWDRTGGLKGWPRRDHGVGQRPS